MLISIRWKYLRLTTPAFEPACWNVRTEVRRTDVIVVYLHSLAMLPRLRVALLRCQSLRGGSVPRCLCSCCEIVCKLLKIYLVDNGCVSWIAGLAIYGSCMLLATSTTVPESGMSSLIGEYQKWLTDHWTFSGSLMWLMWLRKRCKDDPEPKERGEFAILSGSRSDSPSICRLICAGEEVSTRCKQMLRV